MSKSTGVQGEQKGTPPKLNAARNITNIGTVNMAVKTEVNADPARVLVALEEGMDRLKKYKRAGSRLPVLG